MCLTPILIKNPHLGHDKSNIYKSQAWKYDCTSQYIYVPCGHCKQCIAVKQMYFAQRVQMEARNSFLYFSTLTYDNEHLPKVTTSTGYDIPFSDYRHFNLFIKRLRNHNSFGRPFRFLACSERGSEKGRPHFHCLWFFPKYENEDYNDGLSLQKKYFDVIKDAWCVNLGSHTKPIYEPLFTYKTKFYRGKLYSNYDTHFVRPSLTSEGVSSVAFYVCKYLLKSSDKERRLQQALRLNLDESEYEAVWNLVKSRSFRSSYFGYGFGQRDYYDVCDYLHKCVLRSDVKLGYPCYFNPDSGVSFPLAPYYKTNPLIFDEFDSISFKMESPVIYDADIDYQLIKESARKFENIQLLVDSKDMQLDFNFLFD